MQNNLKKYNNKNSLSILAGCVLTELFCGGTVWQVMWLTVSAAGQELPAEPLTATVGTITGHGSIATSDTSAFIYVHMCACANLHSHTNTFIYI